MRVELLQCLNYTLAQAEIIDPNNIKHTFKLPVCQPVRELTPCLGREDLCINPKMREVLAGAA